MFAELLWPFWTFINHNHVDYYEAFVCVIPPQCENANEKNLHTMLRTYSTNDKYVAPHRSKARLCFGATVCLESSWNTQCARDLRSGRPRPLSVRTARVIKNQLRLGLWLQVGWSHGTGEKALGEWWVIWVLLCLAAVSCDNKTTDNGTLLMLRSLALR